MDLVRVVQSQGRTLAIFLGKGLPVDGARFITEEQDALQLGVFNRPAGYQVRAHRHVDLPIEKRKGAEFLYFESGEAKVTVFDDAWEVIAEETVHAGDVLLFLAGGHQVEMLKPTRFIEVKQGPYPGDDRAKIFRDQP
jgi:mannose-6-phosphate isomerase-like protein (cupin superfamily)